MKAIRKVINVKKNEITIKGLESLNNRAVEVIILPVYTNEAKSSPDKRNMKKYCGAGISGFSDTSLNVDKLVYGR